MKYIRSQQGYSYYTFDERNPLEHSKTIIASDLDEDMDNSTWMNHHYWDDSGISRLTITFDKSFKNFKPLST